MRVLITGGAGFIGANLTRYLQADGMSVSVLDNFSRGKEAYIPEGVVIHEGDIRDESVLYSAMRDMDAVIHLAAYGSVVESVSSPFENFSINVHGTFTVLDCARKSHVKKFLFASTGGALIGEANPPVDEQSLPRPISPYGAGKLCGEAYCHAFSKSYEIETVALRFANVYGPYSGHKTGVITNFIKNVNIRKALTIYGDGSTTRDYVHVNDLCMGIQRALNADLPGGEVFHLASGVETSVLELATKIIKLMNAEDHPIRYKPNRAGEVDRNFASYRKASEILGYSPKYSLDDGLMETILWFKENEECMPV